MAIDNFVRKVNKTVTSSNATLATAATAFDTAMTTQMNLVLATPPTGFVAGSITLLTQSLIFDAENYVFAGGFFYLTNTAT